MKRTALARKTPLTRGKPPKRRKPIARCNRRRRAARREVTFGERGALVRALPCLARHNINTTCDGAIEAAHVRSRGAGGTRRDLVPLCAKHHREQHDRGIATFQARYKLDLIADAARIAADLDTRGVP